jgi:hypothetical protein
MEKINNLSRGKACLGEKVSDSEGNIGTITNYELRNGKKGFVEITYEDGTSHWREKYAVERGIFKKPYFDDIEELLNTGEWKYIPGYEGRYIINKNGDIKSAQGQYKGKLLSPSQSGKYMLIGLQYGDTREERKPHRVHRLVAETFIRRLEDGEEVDHIDGNSVNNAVSNLRIVDRKTNNQKYLDLSYIGFTKEEQDKLQMLAIEKDTNIMEIIVEIVKEKLCDSGINH